MFAVSALPLNFCIIYVLMVLRMFRQDWLNDHHHCQSGHQDGHDGLQEIIIGFLRIIVQFGIVPKYL